MSKASKATNGIRRQGRRVIPALRRSGAKAKASALKAYPDGATPWYYPANGRASEFAETRDNNLQAIWTNEVEFDAGVEQVQELCQEVMDKEPL